MCVHTCVNICEASSKFAVCRSNYRQFSEPLLLCRFWQSRVLDGFGTVFCEFPLFRVILCNPITSRLPSEHTFWTCLMTHIHSRLFACKRCHKDSCSLLKLSFRHPSMEHWLHSPHNSWLLHMGNPPVRSFLRRRTVAKEKAVLDNSCELKAAILSTSERWKFQKKNGKRF